MSDRPFSPSSIVDGTHLLLALSLGGLPGIAGGPWESCAHGTSRIVYVNWAARRSRHSYST